MRSASYQPESDLIISSIKAEISLKINAIASYCPRCTLDDGGGRAERAASDAPDEMSNLLSVWIQSFPEAPSVTQHPPQLRSAAAAETDTLMST